MNKNKKEKECPEGKIRNPKTNRCIKIRINNKKECPEGKIRNPKTNRCIKIRNNNKKECPEGKIRNPKTNRCIKIRNNNKKDIKKKENLFKKLFYPFINRINTNINDRIKYNYLLRKILNINETNNNYCLRLYKYDSNRNPIYRIGDKIILKKQIGTDSENGIIFLSSVRNKYNNIFKYAIKCIPENTANKKEIKLLKLVSDAVLNEKCLHFPILYSDIKCTNFLNFDNDNDNDNFRSHNSNTNNNSNSNRIMQKEIENIKNYPKIIQKNKKKSFYFLLTELANGDLKTFLEKFHNDHYLLLNAFVQIFISLMFFYQETKHFHNDAHWGNFLYHKVKPGGYFHYKIFNKDYYIENYGFLWVIWDFGNAITFNSSKKEMILIDNDFKTIIYEFMNNFNFTNDFKIIIDKINKELFKDTLREIEFVQPNKYHPHIIYTFKRKYNIYSQLPNKIFDKPADYLNYIIYSQTNMKDLIEFIMNIFLKNKIIKTNLKPYSKIINHTPYKII